MIGYLVNEVKESLTASGEIQAEVDILALEESAKKFNPEKVAIKLVKGGEASYWSPLGECKNPYWYNQ